MDTPEMQAGVTCYLGVNVEGALFSIGDGHARQGEGETCGVAIECAMDTVVAIDQSRAVPLRGRGRVRHTHHVDGIRSSTGGRIPHRSD